MYLLFSSLFAPRARNGPRVVPDAQNAPKRCQKGAKWSQNGAKIDRKTVLKRGKKASASPLPIGTFLLDCRQSATQAMLKLVKKTRAFPPARWDIFGVGL